MDYLLRPKYIKKISDFVNKPVIKVITGMRRVGKSTLLMIIKNELLKSIPETNKIHLNFESTALFYIKNSNELITYIKEQTQGISGKLYFFFAEIQLVANWETVINGLAVDYDCDIYTTGSNSTLISGDLATLLAGRYVQFEIQPFSFSEFALMYQDISLSNEQLFAKYLEIGGLPF